MGGAHRNQGGEVGGALEDQSTGPLRQEGRYTVDHIGGYVGGQESGFEGGGIDFVEASFNVQEKRGELQFRSLESLYLMCDGEADVGGAEFWQGATLVQLE